MDSTPRLMVLYDPMDVYRLSPTPHDSDISDAELYRLLDEIVLARPSVRQLQLAIMALWWPVQQARSDGYRDDDDRVADVIFF